VPAGRGFGRQAAATRVRSRRPRRAEGVRRQARRLSRTRRAHPDRARAARRPVRDRLLDAAHGRPRPQIPVRRRAPRLRQRRRSRDRGGRRRDRCRGAATPAGAGVARHPRSGPVPGRGQITDGGTARDPAAWTRRRAERGGHADPAARPADGRAVRRQRRARAVRHRGQPADRCDRASYRDEHRPAGHDGRRSESESRSATCGDQARCGFRCPFRLNP
jgi:hypothetical protein